MKYKRENKIYFLKVDEASAQIVANSDQRKQIQNHK